MNLEKIIDYIMYTSYNSNVNIMRSLMSGIDEDVREKIIKYALTTPGNPNRAVLRSTSINDKNYLIEATGASEGIVTVNYEVVDGYNIFFDDDNYQYPWFSVRKGESFIIPDFIMGQYTDEINTYQAGDIITPISDITLTIIR